MDDGTFDPQSFLLTFFPIRMDAALLISMTADRLGIESRFDASPRHIYTAPASDWIKCSQRLDENGVMTSEELGTLDALIFRGETSTFRIVCDEIFLLSIGLVRCEEMLGPFPKAEKKLRPPQWLIDCGSLIPPYLSKRGLVEIARKLGW